MICPKLDAEEFADELRESLFDDGLWAAFLEGPVAERTRVAVVDLTGSLRGQLSKRADDHDWEWEGRTKRLLMRVQSRITQTNQAIRENNKASSASVESVSRKWGALAASLGEALAQSDMAFMLDEIFVGDVTAGFWLEKRREIARARGTEND